eukprot:3275090-Amphidinium_carterae.2
MFLNSRGLPKVVFSTNVLVCICVAPTLACAAAAVCSAVTARCSDAASPIQLLRLMLQHSNRLKRMC